VQVNRSTTGIEWWMKCKYCTYSHDTGIFIVKYLTSYYVKWTFRF